MSLGDQQPGDPCVAACDGSLPRNRILIIDQFALRRRSLELMLRLHGPDLVVQSIHEIGGAQLLEADVVLYAASGGDHDADKTISNLQRIREACGRVPIAAYTDIASVDMALDLLRADINGVIWMSMDVDLVLAAIRLVCAGGTFVPRDVLLVEGPRGVHTSTTDGLTHREEQILELVRHGKPNKLIAHALGITENTVKVHLYRLMRKLGATNRTEVALHADLLHHPAPSGLTMMHAAEPN